ncbi:MAG: hypothetical protein GXP08_00635 [Gammaproteobacteria bacterium]|nr:hypothetical protein [Gammaproteobacteria bacterium]
MKIKKPYLSVLISALIAGGGLVACSSGGSSGEAGALKNRSGVITGFGSVFVNGVEYETDNAIIRIDGQPGTEDDLAIGMVVTLSGSVNDDGASGTALSIDYDDEVKGSISAINLSGGIGSIDILGQTINIDADTSFESDDVNITAISMLQVGNVVEVSGYSTGAGEIFATRIEVKSAVYSDGEKMEVKGLVSNLDTVAMTFDIGNLTIDYSNVSKFDDFPASGIRDGQLVEAKTRSAISGNIMVATELELESEDGKYMDGDDGDEVEIEGVVTVALDGGQFTINDQIVIIDDFTEFEHGSVAGILVGVKLEVEGALDVDGRLVASEIEFREAAETEIEAPIQAVSLENNSITVLGLEIQVNTLTRMKDERDEDDMIPERYFSLSDLTVGDWVEVSFYENDSNARIATEVERDDGHDDGMVKLEGVITEITETGMLVVSGIRINASVSMNTFSVGEEVEVEGMFADGVLTATSVSIDD